MISIVSLLVVVFISVLVVRIAAIALANTGLSMEAARFQARSAFTGAGFTTNESEKVVNHPVRRRIILILMLLGNAGIISAVSSLMLTFIAPVGYVALTIRVVLLVTGLVIMWVIVTSRWMERHLSRLIRVALKRYTELDVKDYANIMHLAGDYRIVELLVEPGDWIADQTLAQSRLREEGIVVLGIQRQDGSYLGVPHGETKVETRDTLIAYGRIGSLDRLDQRDKKSGGQWSHLDAVAEQVKVIEEEA